MNRTELVAILQGVDRGTRVTEWGYEQDVCEDIAEIKIVSDGTASGERVIRFATTETFDDPGDVVLWRRDQ